MNNLFPFFIAVLLASNICHAKNEDIADSKKYALTNESFRASNSIADIQNEKIFNLLLSNKFDDLEKLLSDSNKQFNDDISYEAHLLRAYETFSSIGAGNYEAILDIFNKWVSLKKSAISYAARGHYISGQAYRIRGEKYINSTPAANLEIARKLWSASLADLKKSIEIDKTLVPSYNRIMAISMSAGDRTAAQEAISKAIIIKPQIFYMRSNYIDYLQPKWGGSYREAEEFVKDAQNYGAENPRIWSLRGFVPSMQAYQYQLDGKNALALSKYAEALKYGDRLIWLRGKAFNQYMLGEYKGAITSMTKVASYLSDEDKKTVLQTINILKAAGDKKPLLRPADSLDDKGNFDGPLGWSDFQ